MSRIRDLLRICRWTLIDPIRVNRILVGAGGGWLVRGAWCLLASAAGIVLSLIALPAPNVAQLLVLPAIGIAIALLASLAIESSGTDSLSIMVLGGLLMVLAVPGAEQDGSPLRAWNGPTGILGTLGLLVLIAVGIALVLLLVRAGGNRSFMFWPLGLGFYLPMAALPHPSWLSRSLAAILPLPPESFHALLLLLILFVFKIFSTETCIQSFKHHVNTENCYALVLREFKRWLVLTYALLAVLCYAWSFYSVEPSRLRWLALALAAGALLELDIPQFAALSGWLTHRNLQIRMHRRLHEAVPEHSLLFAVPAVPLEPLGMQPYLNAVAEQVGRRAAGELVVELLLHTSYRRTAERWLEKLAEDDRFLGFELQHRLAAAAPKASAPAQEESKARRRGVTAAAPLTIPKLSSQEFEGVAFKSLLFSHHYQAPRGKEGAPLAALPIWFPVAARPLETMTLPQIIYRCLASVREPFRRTRLILPRPEDARTTFSDVLGWALGWARSGVGASVLPVALSLRRLCESSSRLSELADQLRQQRTEQGDDAEDAQREFLRHCCREILELGTASLVADAAGLTTALETGNAWILVEDDRGGSDGDKNDKAELKNLKRAFDLVFGVSGMSHAAILVVTARSDCEVLSDIQTFRLTQPHELAPAPVTASVLPGRTIRRLCRWTAYWGSPSIKVALAVSAVIALGLMVLAVSSYDTIIELKSVSDQASAGPPSANPVPFVFLLPVGLFALLPMVIGYVWGLSYGSEEVRQAAVEVMITSMIGFFASLLVLLPKSMEPGLWRSFWVFLGALPGSALLSMAAVMMTSLCANVIWLLLSVRIARLLTGAGLQQLACDCRLVLHIARHGAELPLPRGLGAQETLPLLVSFRQQGILPRVVATFPQLAGAFRRAIFLGLKGRCQDQKHHFDYACSSLLISSLLGIEVAACKTCLCGVASDCVDNWPRRKEFSEYHEPSSTMRMNALEYAARYLCCLTNMEELVVVR